MRSYYNVDLTGHDDLGYTNFAFRNGNIYDEGGDLYNDYGKGRIETLLKSEIQSR